MTPGGDDDDNPPSADCTAATCGEVRIALTDADGDFLSYTVDLVSIRLEDGNGDDFQVLPTNQRVDIVELAAVSEFISALEIPAGTYERAIVRLDFTDAAVNVEVDGSPEPATVVDPNGDALEEVDVEIVFDEANPLVIDADEPALLQLDLDLEASHEVNLGTTPVTATAAPIVVATIEPVDTREFRVRGPLLSVDEAAGRYVVDLRPFNQRSGRNGEFTVLTTDDTTCEVNGRERVGADCLAALGNLPDETLTVAHGDYDLAAREFTALRVLAGDSVPGEDFDTAIGVVVARNLNQLVLRGGTLIRAVGGATFLRGDIRVAIDSATDVTKDGSGGAGPALDSGDVSVGQRIQAFGEASPTNSNPSLDATGGRVRLHETELTGFVASAVTGELALGLISVDGRDPQFFDFDGTGTSLLGDADPDNYQVDTGDIDLDEIDDDEGVAAFGFVAPFGSAPPDFVATEVVDFDDLRALLGIGWGFAGTEAPFLSMGASGFVIDVANFDLGQRRFLEIGPHVLDITSDLPEPITVEPPEGGAQLYAVALDLEVEVFSDFSDFSSRVNSLLNGGNAMRSFTARGVFDPDTTTLEANYVAVGFVGP